MKHTLKKLTDTKVSLDITVTADELGQAKDFALKKLAPSLKVAGFRPGKVPVHVAEKNLDPAALANEVIDAAINRALNEAIVAEDLRVLDKPSVEIGEFKPYETLSFTSEIEVLPTVTLGDYKKLKAKKGKVSVSEDEIAQMIERMQKGFAEKKEIERKAKIGDEVVIDFEGRDEKGELVGGAAGNDYPITLGSNTFIPGFEDGIVGHAPGDVFDLPLTFPDDYHATALKGALVTFKTTLKKVMDVVVPEVDDEFAQKAGPFKTVSELRDDVRRELMVQKEREIEDKYKDDLLGELAEKSTVPVPELLIDDQIKSIEQDFQQNLMYRGMAIEQYLEAQGFKDREDWLVREARPAAERRVKSGLVLAELSKIEKIEATQLEIEARYTEMKQQYPDPGMQKQLETPEARRDLSNRILTEKTVDRLVEINT